MKRPSNPASEASELRDMARRARRLSQTLSDPADQDRLSRYAQELEQQAIKLEAKATPVRSPPVPQVTQQQHQPQQQQAADEPPADAKGSN